MSILSLKRDGNDDGEAYIQQALDQIEAARHDPTITGIDVARQDLYMNDDLLNAMINLIVDTYYERQWEDITFSGLLLCDSQEDEQEVLPPQQLQASATWREFLASQLEMSRRVESCSLGHNGSSSAKVTPATNTTIQKKGTYSSYGKWFQEQTLGRL